VLFVDGKPGLAHDRVADPVFSPDSKQVACAVLDDGAWRV
jgi:hypothetical protein